MEYLFAGEHPALARELDRAAQAGFRPAEEYAAVGLDAAVCLHSTVNMADRLRLQAAKQRNDSSAMMTAQLMIAKVYLGGKVSEAHGHGGKHKDDNMFKNGKLQIQAP